MTVLEILNEIHSENVEDEVFLELSKWMVSDRNKQANEVTKQQAVIKAIQKIAVGTTHKTDALNAIKNLCDLD